MNDANKQNKTNLLLLFITGIIVGIFCISLFNYIVDPYFIFRDSSIKGFNNVKTYKYANRRSILYSDMKINAYRTNSAFVGNCLLSRFGAEIDNTAFWIIPVATVEEVAEIIKNIKKISPKTKKLYWGLMLQDLWYEPNDEVTDKLPDIESKYLKINDFINLFCSWSTTKFSILTVFDSIKHKGKDIVYIYPYREIAGKKNGYQAPLDVMNKIKDIIEEAEKNGIEIVVYHSPLHITKDIHIYECGMWNKNIEFKKRLAQITPFYDYSLINEYNSNPLDENSKYFIDNIHPTDILNNMIIRDILSDNKTLGIKITKDNVDIYTNNDTDKLIKYINQHKELSARIKNVTDEDRNVKLRKI